MKYRGLLMRLGILVVTIFAINIYSANPARVEDNYARGVYPLIGTVLRILFGWLPFSIGDILYGLLFAWLLWKMVQGIRTLIKKKISWKSFTDGFIHKSLKVLTLFLILNIVFYGIWGINYKRRGIAAQLELKIEKYSLQDLKDLNALLVQKVNGAKTSLLRTTIAYPSNSRLFEKSREAYDSLAGTYPFLRYKHNSIKSSIWGSLCNYLGIGGYYIPFTGEAQVNTTMPKFLLPFTTCHEMAHQLGYAKEMEANFVGYMAAVASPDTLFHYSVYLDLLMYSNRNLFRTDSAAARSFGKELIPEVKADIKEWRDFSLRHRNPAEPLFRWAYGKYLENNEQPQGMLSYDEVTGFLIAFYKKFGRI